MTEDDFWDQLEYRVSRELACLPERTLRHRWCDGFIPYDYFLAPPDPRITGLAWMAEGHSSRQEQWPFTLFLPDLYSERNHIDWDALLPPENMTCWLGIDVEQKRLEIDLSSAVPDDQYVPTVQLLLHTRPGCHLCERLEALLAPMLEPRRVELKLNDITEDDAAMELYWSRIPVLIHDGRVILEGKPEPGEIAAALAKIF